MNHTLSLLHFEELPCDWYEIYSSSCRCSFEQYVRYWYIHLTTLSVKQSGNIIVQG